MSSQAHPDPASGSDDGRVYDWESYQDALARHCGLTICLAQELRRKRALGEEIASACQARSKALEQLDIVEGLKRRLEGKRLELEDAVVAGQKAARGLLKANEELWPSAQSFSAAKHALEAARRRVEDANTLLAGEKGRGRLSHLTMLLDARRRIMISQVAGLYPLAVCTSPASPGALPVQSQPPSSENASMAIAGLQLLAPLKKKPGLFDEKYDYEVSATALGYVAHVVSLVAAYLDVQLRYPIRLRASRSYIQDPSPAFDVSGTDVGPIVPIPAAEGVARAVVEFPLFSEGQDLTRSAYAVFLLNKDLEQLLNCVGLEAVGPRHTLPNLNRLLTRLLWEGTMPREKE